MSHAPPPPFRPLPIRAFNALGRGAAKFGVRGFSLAQDSLLAAVSKAAKLDDFGPETFLPGLARLIDSLERDAKLGEAWFQRGRAVRRMGEREAALQDLDTAVRLDPGQARWIFERGETLRLLRQNDRAIADMTEAIRLDPTVHYFYNYRSSLYSYQR